MIKDNSQVCPRILIIEDDEDQRLLLCDALRVYYGDMDGDQISSVGTAGEALKMDLGEFDIVLEDYNLPDMSGEELLKRILGRCDIPVIVVTSENLPTTAAQAIRVGAQDYVVKLGDYLFALPVLIDKNIRQHQVRRENVRLQQELEAMLSELRDKNDQLEDSMQKVQKMAATDHLTGLSNRRRFNELLERSFNEAVRYGFDLTCCMCDLDHYKHFNDTLGHQLGDELLIVTADVIRSSLRGSDMAARYGGDEFILLLPHTTVERGLAVGERIRRRLMLGSRKFATTEQAVTMSIGLSSLQTDHPQNADALVAMADRALYMAKEHGKDQIVAYGRSGATLEHSAGK